MLNSTHATTVRSLAVNTRTIALLNFQAQTVQSTGTNNNVRRRTTLPAFKRNSVKSCVTQKHAAKVNKLTAKSISWFSTQFIFLVPHCMSQRKSYEAARPSLNWVNSIRSVCTSNVLGVIVVIITLQYLFKLTGILPSSMEYDADYTKTQKSTALVYLLHTSYIHRYVSIF